MMRSDPACAQQFPWDLTPKLLFLLDMGGHLTYSFFMYIASIRTTFSAAHHIKGYKGNCAEQHGHNYRVEVQVASQVVNETGMSVDFRKLRHITNDVLSELDHKSLNELPFFSNNNPTAENIARYIFDHIKPKIPAQLSLHCIRIWETDDYMVEYRD